MMLVDCVLEQQHVESTSTPFTKRVRTEAIFDRNCRKCTQSREVLGARVRMSFRRSESIASSTQSFSNILIRRLRSSFCSFNTQQHNAPSHTHTHSLSHSLSSSVTDPLTISSTLHQSIVTLACNVDST